MANETTAFDKDSILFTQLVLSFQASAMQQMGKIKNPFTDTIERNMSQAQMSIDMLTMIQTKMKGNMTDEESRLLDRILFEVRMNYVDEVEKDKKKAEEEKEKEAHEKEATVEEKETEKKEEMKAEKAEEKKEEKKEKKVKKPSPKAKGKKADSDKKRSQAKK